MKVATNQERLNELFDADPRKDTAIADDLGVSKQAISAWRNGSRSPKKSMLELICEKFDVNIQWLMGFDVDKHGNGASIPIVIKNMDQFSHLLQYMTREEYDFVITAFDNAYKRIKEKGVEL